MSDRSDSAATTRLDIRQVMAALPHRYPMLLVDRVEREQQLTFRSFVPRAGGCERFTRCLIKARRLLIGEERERAVTGTTRIGTAAVEFASGDRVVRRVAAVERQRGRLAGVPDDQLLEIYTALRPGRSTIVAAYR